MVKGDVPTDVEHPTQNGLCLLGRHPLFDTPFSLLQAGLGCLRLIGEEEQNCIVHTQAWTCAHQCLGQRVHPLEHCVELTLEPSGERNWFDQAGSELSVGNGKGVLHCFDKQRVLLVPGAGTAMQDGQLRWLCLLKVAAQYLSKQVVVAVPAPLVVQCDHKQRSEEHTSELQSHSDLVCRLLL